MQTQNWISLSMYNVSKNGIAGCTGCTISDDLAIGLHGNMYSLIVLKNNTHVRPHCVASTHSQFMPIEIEQTSEEVKGQRTLKFPHSRTSTSEMRGDTCVHQLSIYVSRAPFECLSKHS